MPKSSILRPLAEQLLAEAGSGEITDQQIADAAEASFERIPAGLLIPLDRLEPWDQQPRKSFDEAKIATLASSIAVSGLLEPLVVRRNPGRPGHYIIIAGHCRLLAARRLFSSGNVHERKSVEVLPCIVREQTDDVAFADALVENLIRNDLTRAEVMAAIVRLQNDYGWSVREIARRTARNPGDLSVLLRVARDPHLSALVNDESISPTTAGYILRLPPERQQEAVDLARDGRLKTVADVQRLLAAIAPHETPATGQEHAPAEPERLISNTSQDDVPAQPDEGGGRLISNTRAALDAVGESATPGEGTAGGAPVDAHAHSLAQGQHSVTGAASPRAVAAERDALGDDVAVAQRLARDMIAFVHARATLDAGTLVLLQDAHAALGAYLAAQGATTASA